MLVFTFNLLQNPTENHICIISKVVNVCRVIFYRRRIHRRITERYIHIYIRIHTRSNIQINRFFESRMKTNEFKLLCKRENAQKKKKKPSKMV